MSWNKPNVTRGDNFFILRDRILSIFHKGPLFIVIRFVISDWQKFSVKTGRSQFLSRYKVASKKIFDMFFKPEYSIFLWANYEQLPKLRISDFKVNKSVTFWWNHSFYGFLFHQTTITRKLRFCAQNFFFFRRLEIRNSISLKTFAVRKIFEVIKIEFPIFISTTRRYLSTKGNKAAKIL